VAGVGTARATVMLVGEQPGDREDIEGRPFVGPAGALLDAALQEAGIRRADVFVTNAVKHFKWTLRGKRRLHRTPAQREIDACSYWLERELSKVRATVIVALGATALRAVRDEPAARLQDYFGRASDARGRQVVATWHPSYVLRAPDPDARARARAELVDALRLAARMFTADDLLSATPLEVAPADAEEAEPPLKSGETGGFPSAEQLQEYLKRLNPEDLGRFNP